MVYLDYAASAPMYREAADKMHEIMLSMPGNPGGLHRASTEARSILQKSRRSLAELLDVLPQEIFFTSGGTESNNWAVKCALEGREKGHIILSASEHSSLLESARAVEGRGFCVSYVKPDSRGLVSADAVAAAIRPDTRLISVQGLNNETGVIQDVEAIAQLARSHRILFHCDAVQSFGHVRQPLCRADLISLSAHKLGGPSGVGALVIRQPLLLTPLIHGGGQELGLRAGTENVPGIAAFALAAELACGGLEAEQKRLSELTFGFVQALRQIAPEMEINGDGAPRSPHILNLRFPGVSGEALVTGLDMQGVCASPGAACAARDASPSHVLMAMGLGELRARESLRFSFGPGTDAGRLEYTARCIGKILRKEG